MAISIRAADCHAHVFCLNRYPQAPDALYTPDVSQAGTARKFLDVLDASRGSRSFVPMYRTPSFAACMRKASSVCGSTFSITA